MFNQVAFNKKTFGQLNTTIVTVNTLFGLNTEIDATVVKYGEFTQEQLKLTSEKITSNLVKVGSCVDSPMSLSVNSVIPKVTYHPEVLQTIITLNSSCKVTMEQQLFLETKFNLSSKGNFILHKFVYSKDSIMSLNTSLKLLKDIIKSINAEIKISTEINFVKLVNGIDIKSQLKINTEASSILTLLGIGTSKCDISTEIGIPLITKFVVGLGSVAKLSTFNTPTIVKYNNAEIGMNMNSKCTPMIVKYGISTNDIPMKITSFAGGKLGAEKYIILENMSLKPGDELIIDTCKMLITINGKNSMKYLTADSEFFSLLPGDNEIQYYDESNERNIMVDITWKDRWL